MRHRAGFAIMVMVFGLAAAAPAGAQATFKIPFAFESGDAQITFQQVSTGKETVLPVTEPLKPPQPPVAEPRVVFDETGAFEPSYTEYFTIYVVAEVWLSGQEGYLIHVTKGAHKTRVVNGTLKNK
jgi:hypothetical protein